MADELQIADELALASPEASEYDLLFPVIPTFDDPAPPEDDALALVDDVADFALDAVPLDVSPEEERSQESDLAFDWASGEPWATADGEPLVVDDEEAVVEQLLKALYTRRDTYPIYSENYGSDLDALVGVLPGAALYSEVSRTVTETLKSHPRVDRAEVISIDRTTGPPSGFNNGLIVTAEVTIDGDEPVQLDLAI